MIKKEKSQNLVNLNFWINRLILKQGKLSKSSFIMDKIYFLLIKNFKEDPFIILNEAIENVSPVFLIKNKRIGKRVITQPFFIISDINRRFIGLKWLIKAALKRKGDFYENFILEISDAFNNKGSVKKKLNDLNLNVIENRFNLKYRW